MALEKLAEIVENLGRVGASLTQWKSAADQNIVFLLRAQEQTDRRIDTFLPAQNETRDELRQIRAELVELRKQNPS